MIDQVGCFTVNGNVDFFVALHPFAGCGVEFYKPDKAEIRAVRQPQASVCRVEQKSGINGITIFIIH